MTDDLDPITAFEEAARKHAAALDDLRGLRSLEPVDPVQAGLGGAQGLTPAQWAAFTILTGPFRH